MDADASVPGGGASGAQPVGLDLALDDLIRSAKKPRNSTQGARGGRGGGRGGGRDHVPVRRGGVDKPASRGRGGGRGGGRSILSRLGPPPGARRAGGPSAVPYVDNKTGYKKVSPQQGVRLAGKWVKWVVSLTPGCPPQFERVATQPDGTVSLFFNDTAVVTVRLDSSVVCDSAGHQHSKATQKSIGGALALFGLTLKCQPDTAPGARAGDVVWQVSDGQRLLRRFTDGLVLPPPPPSHQPSRAQLLLQSYPSGAAMAPQRQQQRMDMS
jgi:hypothetical protein